MGQAIRIVCEGRAAPADPVTTFIRESYERLAQQPGFVMREGQLEMSSQIANALIAGEPIAAEAPTGTGKTVAYLIGAIAAAEVLRGNQDVPIVIATATTGLQGQILSGDLPNLVRAGIIAGGDAVLAKGRNRYFCISNAERFLAGRGKSDGQFDFFSEQGNERVEALAETSELLESWNSLTWTGDVDNYHGASPKHWSIVGASAETCIGYKCEHYSSCPFFHSRRVMSAARIVIANHDLVLADLAMYMSDGESLFPGGQYIVVFDEAHHLPQKAMEIGSSCLDVVEACNQLAALAGFSRNWRRNSELLRILEKGKISADEFDAAALVNALTAVREEADTIPVDDDTRQCRFPKGVVPERLMKACANALTLATALKTALAGSMQVLKASNIAEKQPGLAPLFGELLAMGSHLGVMVSNIVKALAGFTGANRSVRWLFRNEMAVSLHTSPLEGADVLRNLVWGSSRPKVAMVSATLRDFGSFDRFKEKCGAPSGTRTFHIEPNFPYRECQFRLVNMAAGPKFHERAEFIKELTEILPDFVDGTEGTLVLFPSRSMMKAVVPELRRRFRADMILCQGETPVRELVSAHKARIDRGEGSVLCGLATLAEGLDLPGAYCTHVMICALPFAVPTSPVEQEIQEMLGKDYFGKRALPDAFVRLVQMVGRLMRRESDRGRITMFDKRLSGTSWGRKMLFALPAFKRCVLPARPEDSSARI